MDMQRILRFLIPAIFVVLAWFLWPYIQSAETQVGKAQADLLGHAAKRDWPEVKDLMATNFQGMWELNRDDSISEAGEVFQGFLYLNIDWFPTEVTVNGDTAKVRGSMKMNGSGAGLSQMLMDKVNGLQDPWVFTWRKESWTPSSWRLVSVFQSEIDKASVGDVR